MGYFPGMWVRNNYVNRLGIYLVLPVEIGGNVSLDRTTPHMAKVAMGYAAKGVSNTQPETAPAARPASSSE
jgi:hypothetical protein